MKNRGYSDVVLGLQFGDEGKARVIDHLASDYDIIARFNGGANAGHTIKNEHGVVALHQVPSGIFYPHTTLYIGSGCVVNIEKLANEIEKIRAIGIDISNRLKISPQAAIVQPHHMLLDPILGKTIGTTKNGIGPAYADRAMRMYRSRIVHIRMGDLAENPDEAFEAMATSLQAVIEEYGIEGEDPALLVRDVQNAYKKIAGCIQTDPLYLQKRVEGGARALFEGAQSAMLDVTKGSVPYVTSSNTIASAAYVGGDLSLKYHRKTIGVAKAIMSRVGNGPFPGELGGKRSEVYCAETVENTPKYSKAVEQQTYDFNDLIKSTDPFDVGIAIRMISEEYGTVTTRPRRVGILDLVQLTYAANVNGVDELIINKCDLLREFSRTKQGEIPIVTSYALHGKKIDYIPAASSAFYHVSPGVEYIDSFDENITAARSSKDLPKALITFVEKIEATTRCKVVGLGVGPAREQFVTLR